MVIVMDHAVERDVISIYFYRYISDVNLTDCCHSVCMKIDETDLCVIVNSTAYFPYALQLLNTP